MQKHEREVLRAAQQEANRWGITAYIEGTCHGSKLKLILKGPKGTKATAIPCSPRVRDNCINTARQWVRRHAGALVGEVK